jgi:hypothetical protein
MGLALADLGNLACDRADFEAAHSLYRESLRTFQELDYKRGVAQLLESFARVAADQGQTRRALGLAGAAAALRHSLGTPLRPSEQAKLEASLETARQKLSDSECAAAWVDGWARPLEEAVEIALTSAPV